MLKSSLPSDFFDRATKAGLKVEDNADEGGKILTMPHDGYKFLIVENAPVPEQQKADDPFLHVSLHVSNLEASLNYYREYLGFTVLRDHRDTGRPRVILGFTNTGNSFKVELVQLPAGQKLDHALAIGRLATETEDNAQAKVEANVTAKANGTRDWIVHGPFALPPHNERVIIVK